MLENYMEFRGCLWNKVNSIRFIGKITTLIIKNVPHDFRWLFKILYHLSVFGTS